jgi:hypothetical protein
MNGIPDWIRPVWSRIVAAAVAAGVAYLTRKGIDLGLGDQAQTQLSEGLASVLLGVLLAVYSLAHRAISAKTNPTDAASPSIASAASGPLGAGERSNLGAAFQQMATGETPATTVTPDVPATAPNGITSRPPDFRPPAFEPLVGSRKAAADPPGAAQFIPGAVCQLCTGENGQHYGWCVHVGGNGIAPPGFFDDTRLIEHAFLRKQTEKETGHVNPSVLQTIQENITPEPERSKILKPKDEPPPKPKKKKKKAVIQRAGAPQPKRFDP